MDRFPGLTEEDVGRMTLPMVYNRRSGGKAIDHGAVFATFEEFALYRGRL